MTRTDRNAAPDTTEATMAAQMTPMERKWVTAAKRLLARMPATLTLFGSESGLGVFHVHPETHLPMTAYESVDSTLQLDLLTTRCDGGAW